MKRASGSGLCLLFSCAGLLALASCTEPRPAVSSGAAVVSGNGIRLELDAEMNSRVVSTLDGPGQEIVLGESGPSEYLLGAGDTREFRLQDVRRAPVQDALGRGQRTVLRGVAEGPEKKGAREVTKEVTIDIYDDFPGWAIMQVSYTNTGQEELQLDGWVSNHYRIAVQPGSEARAPITSPIRSPAFWSYHGATYEDRRDWVLPVASGFHQENYLGMNASDYGGGTPVVDVWREDVGLAVGHLETVPKLVSLPVTMAGTGFATMAVEYERPVTLKPGDRLDTLRTFVSVHRGDFFATLVTYREIMGRLGITFDEYPDSAYEPSWCAWGYRRDFTTAQVYGTLHKARELGFEWATLDDGWQTSEGDWYPDPAKFPGGDVDMKKMTDTMRTAGLRPMLWWAPMAVDLGTDLFEDHADYLLVNEQGEYQEISWWDSYYLCSAHAPVREHAKALVRKMLIDWGYDGLKIDGHHLNGAPPCYNPLHYHERPEDSVEAVPSFFQDIYETALAIKPDAVVQICPCGTSYSFFTMPYMNQPVASDPESSWQVRLKGKTFKALMGPSVPYYGDHVELSTGGEDFASTVGVGGIPGSRFTWPVGADLEDSEHALTPAREQAWAHWVRIYQEEMLSRGEYRGTLYDLGFDRPEAHAIAKDDKMYYAFYADAFDGQVELRGLDARTYEVRDYVNGMDLGQVTGPLARLPVRFTGSLLIVAAPGV